METIKKSIPIPPVTSLSRILKDRFLYLTQANDLKTSIFCKRNLFILENNNIIKKRIRLIM